MATRCWIRVPIRSVIACEEPLPIKITFEFQRIRVHEEADSARIHRALPISYTQGQAAMLMRFYEVKVYFHLESGQRVFEDADIVQKLISEQMKGERKRLKEQDKYEKKEVKKQAKYESKKAKEAKRGEGSRRRL